MNYNQSVGAFGERIASNYLAKNGCKIIDKNIKTSYKELDLIAKDNKDVLIFIEVKTRVGQSLGKAEDMLSRRKLYNFKHAAMIYMSRRKPQFSNLRFDFVAIDIDRLKKTAKIKHFKDII